MSVAEIDPKIVDIARESFGLDRLEREHGEDGRFELVIEDGWSWLTSQEEDFDLIINEAFSGSKPLGPLTGEEGVRVVRDHLCEGGTYLATLRLPLEGRKARPLEETCDAFATGFAHAWLVPEAADEPTKPGNNTLVASDTGSCSRRLREARQLRVAPRREVGRTTRAREITDSPGPLSYRSERGALGLRRSQTKKPGAEAPGLSFRGRVDWIRTSDPRVPNAVLYQTEPQPVAREKSSTLCDSCKREISTELSEQLMSRKATPRFRR